MINFSNFFPKDTKIVIKALEFTRELIYDNYHQIAKGVERGFSQPVWDEYKKIVKPIYDTKDFLEKNLDRTFIAMINEDFTFLMDIVSSSLLVYRKHLIATKESTGISGYGDLINEVNGILSLKGPKNAKKDLFEKYYTLSAKENIDKPERKTEVFISYQTKDHKIACEIKRLIVEKSDLNEEDVFVAHRDIPLSKIWRDEIVYHLNSCTHLIALCTKNYRCSTWENQEVGYVMDKDVSIIPFFWEGVERDRFGFLESYQALPEFVNKENIEKTIDKILEKFAFKQ